jgi:phosphoglycolate phosphatase/AHBA synthesis associated protein
VLFDLDGVLIRSYEVWFRLMNAAAAHFGQPAISRETFQSCWGQGLQEDVRRFFPGGSVEEVEAYYDAHFMDHGEHLQVDPDAAPVIAALRERGLSLGVITNTPAALARAILGRAGLAVDFVVGGTDVPEPKPAPDMVLRACQLARVAPAAALVVGDSSYDRAAARAAGVRFAGLQIEGGTTLARLRDVLDLVG